VCHVWGGGRSKQRRKSAKKPSELRL
jgi:hypothetical protein